MTGDPVTGDPGPRPDAAGTGAGRPPTVPVPAGYRVGRWQVTRPVASGAWSSVYAARRAAGDGPDEVALKFLSGAVLTPRLAVLLADLASREAARCSALRHERLVRTLEVLTVHDPAEPRLDGSVVLVMELAAGSLADLLARRPGVPLPAAGRCLREIAEGLAWMHAAGWVHGDLKPGNVLVRAGDGGCCLADFGLAGLLDGTHAYVPPLASPDFAPPERREAVATAEGHQVRPSGDVWAFGVLACLALTGRMPLRGATPWARAEAAAEYAAGARPLALPDGLPTAWRELVTRCLDPDPDRRPAAAELVVPELVASAEEVDGSVSGGRRPWQGRRPGRRRVALAAGPVVAVLVGAMAWQLLPAGPGPVVAGPAPARTSPSPGPSSPVGKPGPPAVPAGTCVSQDRDQQDGVTGRLWHGAWYCLNDPGAAQYAGPDGKQVVGWIVTTTSWFLCYRRGTAGPDGSDVWYYTQGDQVAAGWQDRRAWGYTPAAFVRAAPHPYPGVPPCPPGT